MTVRHGVALALLVAGSAVLLLSAVALIVLPGPHARLHALSPAASLGAPLTALAVAVEAGPGRTALKLLLIGALLAAAGPVTTMAIGRLTTRLEGPEGLDGPVRPADEGRDPRA
ncbi:monovalent cation/H(+) antiporter subunit G [Streptomyces sp. MI02-7b]|uniref:cation:proton antiporter n=1 Tax=Streptomyces sp. MI02-7b TaxID=462941 RepID=UPI0029AB47D2|nr:monovalent cation/H(+) antiporter subunit G [Streptomyces sp. MI02-7b]MDX3076220.1 monovalent cation/H(+) antiporter subunit G [Streptomyces sp. MI02-7b]